MRRSEELEGSVPEQLADAHMQELRDKGSIKSEKSEMFNAQQSMLNLQVNTKCKMKNTK